MVVVTGTAVWLHFGSISSISSCTSMCGGSSHWYFGRTWEVLVCVVVIVTGIAGGHFGPTREVLVVVLEWWY